MFFGNLKMSFFKLLQDRMSYVIELRYEADDEHGHHLFIRPHVTRVEQANRPKGRTIMVCNVPPWCPSTHVKLIFAQFGAVERVDVQLRPGKKEESDEDEVENRFKVIWLQWKINEMF